MRGLRPMLLLGGLASCTVGPDFAPPHPQFASAFHQDSAHPDAAVTEASNPDPQWWDQFGDPVLDTLIRDSIAGNPSLQEGVLRVVAARQQVVSAAAAGLPTLEGTGSYMREQLGLKGILESNGAYSGLNALADANSPLNQYSPGLGQKIDGAGTGLLNQLAAPVNLYQYGLSSSWELDLFGRVRRSVEAAKATQQAQAEAANDALVMLESEVAQTYIQMRAAQNLALQQTQSIAAAQDILNLTQQRYAVGLTSDLDVQQAQAQLLSEQAQLPEYETQEQEAISQLDDLAGQPPGALDALLSSPCPVAAGAGGGGHRRAFGSGAKAAGYSRGRRAAACGDGQRR